MRDVLQRRRRARRRTSTHAIAAAPAPETTTFIVGQLLARRARRAFISAAPEMIAVPCWSSWNTGICMRSRSAASISKHSGALMSSRLMPPNVGSSAATVSMKRVDVLRVELEVEHVDVGELLEQAGLALHHRLAGERADVAEAEHRGAVGDDRDQVAARRVLLRRARGRAAISRHGSATPGVYASERSRWRDERLGRDDLDLSRAVPCGDSRARPVCGSFGTEPNGPCRRDELARAKLALPHATGVDTADPAASRAQARLARLARTTY